MSYWDHLIIKHIYKLQECNNEKYPLKERRALYNIYIYILRFLTAIFYQPPKSSLTNRNLNISLANIDSIRKSPLLSMCHSHKQWGPKEIKGLKGVMLETLHDGKLKGLWVGVFHYVTLDKHVMHLIISKPQF